MHTDKAHIIRLIENICQKDDQKSFEEIFRIFYERLLKFCVAYIHDKEHAEEIVSTVLLKLWMKRKELPVIQNPETYLFIAVKNQSLNYLKQFSNYKMVYLEDEGVHEFINIHDAGKEMEKRELIFKMNQAIETLPDQCKIIFMLVKEEGLKYKEVAQILEISPRTVETQLVRAIKKLSVILAPYIDFKKNQPKNIRKSVKSIKFFLSTLFF